MTALPVTLKAAPIALLACALVLSPPVPDGFATQGQQTRTIPYRLDLPIEARLLPGDQIVIVARDSGAAVASAVPTRSEAVSFLVASSEAAFVFDVDAFHSSFIEGGRWIGTDLSGHVVTVLFQRTQQYRNGQVATVHSDAGGEISVNGVIVRAETDGLRPVARAGRYVVFAHSQSQPGEVVPIRVFGLGDDSAITDPYGAPSLQNPFGVIQGMSLDALEVQLRPGRP